MRTFLKTAIFLLLAAIIGVGSFLGYLLSDTQRIKDFQIPEIEKQGNDIRNKLQDYDREAAAIKREFPVAEPANWVQRIEDGLKKANVSILNQNTRPAQQIRDTNAQSLVFSITVRAESLKQLFEAVSMLEKIDPSGAARVTRFSIPPRRSDDALYSSTIEVTIYERMSSYEDMVVDEGSPEPDEVPPNQPNPK